ncbi:MAG: Fic family protein, partial [Methanomicrobiales archaeon]|nr:Fic family protein [Methanomicrobiales archaeon]
AGANGRKATAILDLYDEMKQTVPEVTRSQYAVAALDALFKTPIFIPSEFYEQTGIPKKTANRLLQQLREQDIITALTEGGGRRATTYVFSRLIAITEGDRL